MRRSSFFFLIAFLLSFSTINSYAQKRANTESEEKSQWTIDDIVMAERPADFQVSPDNGWAVWIRSSPDKDKDEMVGNLQLTRLSDKRTITLTRGSDNCSKPQWSQDGQLLAYLTTRSSGKSKTEKSDDEEAKEQIWLINPFGGEPWQLTESSRGVKSFQWADAETIIYAAQEEPAYREHIITDRKDTSMVMDDEPHEPPVRLFKISVKTKKITRLTDNNDRIQFFTLAPDGRHVFATHDRSLRFIYDNLIKPLNIVWDLQTGEHKQILTDTKFNILQAHWSLDNKGIYLANSTTSSPRYVIAGIIELFYYDLAADTVEKVSGAWERGLSSGPDEIGCFSVTESGALALLSNGVKTRVAQYSRARDGWRQVLLTGEHGENILSFAASKDGKTLVYDHSNSSRPTQLYCANISGGALTAVKQISELNPYFNDRLITKTEIVHWKGALDEEVEGLLYYPHNYKAGAKYPLVVMIHGGPMLADLDEWWETWSNPKNLLCQRGAFVFKPNYHGSSEYGLQWAESISGGKYYDLEVPDIEKGIDYLIARGVADADKIGVMGWSNGAILSIALTVADSRFKVASVVAGDVENASDWATSEFGAAFDNFYFGKTPLEDPQLYFQKSPFYRMANVRTPTIIFHGSEDTSVSPQQGMMHYRALQQLGNTDVRLVIFPGEKHGPDKLVHQQRKLQEEMAWFDKYLFKTDRLENEAFKSDSPLASALKLRSAQQVKGAYGVEFKGHLIPEMARQDNLAIGRFEITQAQYAEFDKNYQVAAGKENYPVNGITFEQAKSYCQWLSALTGENYRIGSAAEMSPIYEQAAEQENTLDYWAGYQINPDDAARLQGKIKELGEGAPLLKAAGSFKGGGDNDDIYDLGGNVAEWAIGENGKGVLMGGSADMPGDAKTNVIKATPQYIGFRVVKTTK
jgi:dipeptidyl aminopeptidase/acylaminoacyl peptidase